MMVWNVLRFQLVPIANNIVTMIIFITIIVIIVVIVTIIIIIIIIIISSSSSSSSSSNSDITADINSHTIMHIASQPCARVQNDSVLDPLLRHLFPPPPECPLRHRLGTRPASAEAYQGQSACRR
jgi:hypothetical protein